jgi:hypothetical protein
MIVAKSGCAYVFYRHDPAGVLIAIEQSQNQSFASLTGVHSFSPLVKHMQYPSTGPST